MRTLAARKLTPDVKSPGTGLGLSYAAPLESWAARIGEGGLGESIPLRPTFTSVRALPRGCRSTNAGVTVGFASPGRDLVAGSGIDFEERAEHRFKGVPGAWTLYAAP